MPKIFLIVELLRLLFPLRLNLPDPRLRQRNAQAAVPSLDQATPEKLAADRILP
jgi:hypothetical protein